MYRLPSGKSRLPSVSRCLHSICCNLLFTSVIFVLHAEASRAGGLCGVRAPVCLRRACSAVAVLRFLTIFEHGALRERFTPGPANHVDSPGGEAQGFNFLKWARSSFCLPRWEWSSPFIVRGTTALGGSPKTMTLSRYRFPILGCLLFFSNRNYNSYICWASTSGQVLCYPSILPLPSS